MMGRQEKNAFVPKILLGLTSKKTKLPIRAVYIGPAQLGHIFIFAGISCL